jgi:hypothetical protein
LVTGLGWYMTKHSVAIYGTSPGPALSSLGGPARPTDEALAANDPALAGGSVVERAGGFAWADPQRAVLSLPQCSPDADARGEITVETYSVAYGRDGVPQRAVVACRTPEGRRAWANVIDPDHLALLVSEEGCGRLGILRGDGTVDLR